MVDLTLCNCDECPLKEQTRVLGEGTSEDPSTNYKVVFVGMAPAREEVRLGRPFVGWSGQIFRQVVEKLGYGDYYVTNTLLCVLPDDLSGPDERKAIECCHERLFKEIQDFQPELIVAFGNMPLKALTGKDLGVRSVEGRVLPGLIAPVLPVLHPASLKRRPEEFLDFAEALRSGPRWLKGTYQQAGVPTTVIVDEDNYPEVLRTIEKAEYVAVDLETTRKGFFPYGRQPDGIRCIAISVDHKTAYIVPGESSEHFEPHPDLSKDPRLIEVLSKAKCITHNGQFDAGFLLQADYDISLFYDTFLAHYLADEREYSHGLKKLAQKFLGAYDWEEDIKKYLPNKNSSYDLIPDEQLYWYASHDVIYTYQLFEKLSKQINGGIFESLIMPCANMFNHLRHRGLRIDVDVLMGLDEVLDREMEAAEEELERLVGYHINPFAYATDCASLIYDELKYKVGPLGRSTRKLVLQNWAGDPIIDKILECRAMGKLRSTYVIGTANFVDRDFRIHPFTKIHGTVTGRISTEDPSVMNISKKGGIKRLYIPEEGHLILNADQKGMELRCYVVLSGDETLRKLILEADADPTKLDPHDTVAAEATRRCGREIKRGPAKTGVFGRLYGRGLESFIRGFRMDRKGAQGLMDTIDGLFPSISVYNQTTKEEIHSQGYLESYFERRRRFGLITDENKHELYRQGTNFKVQSMASDVNLFCMLYMYANKEKFGAVPLFPVHDSVLYDIESEDCIPTVKREMEVFSKELVHGAMDFKIDLEVGPSWGDAVPWKG